jgi:hypothetical protein
MGRKFYKSTITIEVLHEDPIDPNAALEDVAYQVTEGDWVGYNYKVDTKELSGKEAADELFNAGSDPGFFRLDEAGNELND